MKPKQPRPLQPRADGGGSALPYPAAADVREVAQRLRVRPVTVYRLCERGELGHVRVSNAIRVRAEALEAFLAASE